MFIAQQMHAVQLGLGVLNHYVYDNVYTNQNNIASKSTYIVLGVFCLYPLVLIVVVSCWVLVGLGERGLGVHVRLRLACV